MKRISLAILAFALVATASAAYAQSEVIISLNELYRWGTATPLSPKWQRALEVVGDRKMSLGVMGDSLIDNNEEFYKWVKAEAAKGDKDFFSQGYRQVRVMPNKKDMRPVESLQNEKRQNDAFKLCQELAEWNLGFKCTTYASRDEVNDDTAKALNAAGFKNWVIRGTVPAGAKEFKGKTLVLDEKNHPALGNDKSLNFETFKTNLAKTAPKGLVVISVYPEALEESDLAELAKILDHLKAERFTTFAEWFTK